MIILGVAFEGVIFVVNTDAINAVAVHPAL